VKLAKLLLDAGFLVSELGNEGPGPALRAAAEAFVATLDGPDSATRATRALERLAVDGWRHHVASHRRPA
jgi:hypothetical protein